MAGVGIGLFRLGLGLWAIQICRRRGRRVEDPIWIALLEELQVAIGCRQDVALLEIPELTAPATAGWRRPAILLPDDWPAWDDATRRAVLAHELAHIQRRDFATGLVAQLALSLYFYHPMVRWLARRLQLQQELASDAVGVRFAGGRGAYLLALSRLAIRQDRRLPCWPARAFLPARGTLIRRIAMLQEESRAVDRPRSRCGRRLIAVCLVGLTMMVAMLRSPIRAEEKSGSSARKPTSVVPQVVTKPDPSPIDWLHVPDKLDGVLLVRPAAAFRRFGKPDFASLISRSVGLEMWAEMVGELAIMIPEEKLPAFPLDEIEWAALGVRFGVHLPLKGEKEKMHSLQLGVGTVRMNAPFDWPAWLRRYRFELAEVRVGDRSYFKLTGLVSRMMGPDQCVYLPDDRTIVFDTQDEIEKLVRRGKPEVPAYLSGRDWLDASKGILAFAFHNEAGFARRYDLGRPDDVLVLQLLDGVDRWILSVDDTDAIVIRAVAACRGKDTPARIAGVARTVVENGRKEVADIRVDGDPTELETKSFRILRGLLANVRIQPMRDSVKIDSSEGSATLAELAALIEPELKATEAEILKAIETRRQKRQAVGPKAAVRR
jgi:hypothetical protein